MFVLKLICLPIFLFLKYLLQEPDKITVNVTALELPVCGVGSWCYEKTKRWGGSSGVQISVRFTSGTDSCSHAVL